MRDGSHRTRSQASRRAGRQAGHSPTMALATYGHVIEELEGAEQRPAEDVIREARARRVPSARGRGGHAWALADTFLLQMSPLRRSVLPARVHACPD